MYQESLTSKIELVSKAPFVRYLDLSGLGITSFSQEETDKIKRLRGLTYLNLENNRLTSLDVLLPLYVTKVNAAYNKIEKISFHAPLTKITELDLEGNEISNLEFVRFLPNLQSLNISHTKVTNILELKFCKNLKELVLNIEDIEDDPEQLSFYASFSS